VALDLVSSCLVGARITSVIFIRVFIDLTVLNLNADMLNLTLMLMLMLKLMLELTGALFCTRSTLVGRMC
jgi:hypothetical protein